MTYQVVHTKRPTHFEPTATVAICFIMADDRLLMLKSTQHNVWTTPGGKMEESETPLDAAVRELYEETGISVPPTAMQSCGVVYIKRDSLHYPMHLFLTHVKKSSVTLSEEHDTFGWFSLDEVQHLKKHPGADEVLQFFKARNE